MGIRPGSPLRAARVRACVLPLVCGACLPGWAVAQSPSVTELDAVRVVGRAQTLYRVDDAPVGTRTDTPLALVPQSVQVLPRELIEDQAARQVTDLYRSLSGVTLFSYAGVTFRGFRQENMLYDGLRGDPYIGFSVPLLFNIDRVEVLKGPSGTLYGAGDPGGVINYVSKKPQREPGVRLNLQAGNYDYRSGSFEATGPLAGSDRARYRAGVWFEDERPFRNNTDNRNRSGDVGFAFDVGDAGELTLQFTDVSLDMVGNRLRGVPVDDDGAFLAGTGWATTEPTDFLTVDAQVALARYAVSPTRALDLDVSARWFDASEKEMYHEPRGLVDRDGDGVAEWMTREFRDQHRDNTGTNLNANAIWRLGDGGVRHKLLFGADWYRLDAKLVQRTAPMDAVPGIDLFDPVYGLTGGADYDLDRYPWRTSHTRGDRYGVYVQDEISIGERWQLLAGLRWDGFEDRNRVDGSAVDGNDLTWRVGGTWRAGDAVNLYASYATGFAPQGAGNQQPAVGGPFDPEESEQWELGAKTAFGDGRVNLNAALYRIERSNILQRDGGIVDGVDQLAPLGLVRSDGLDVDLLVDLTRRWVLSANYGYNDARVIDAGANGIVNSVGERFVNAPRHQFGLWTRYDFVAIASALAFGAEHVGERVGFDAQTVKPYTVFDLSWQTRWRDWKFQANVKNLFDRRYAVSGFDRRSGHFPGEPRRFYLQATWAF